MSAVDIPRNTTEREQLVKVVGAAQALVNATSDPRVPSEVRDHALRAQYEAQGALNDYDRNSR
jgi:hypothetical protein